MQVVPTLSFLLCGQIGCKVKAGCNLFHPLRKCDSRTVALFSFMGVRLTGGMAPASCLRYISAFMELRAGEAVGDTELYSAVVFMSLGYRLHAYKEYVEQYPLTTQLRTSFYLIMRGYNSASNSEGLPLTVDMYKEFVAYLMAHTKASFAASMLLSQACVVANCVQMATNRANCR